MPELFAGKSQFIVYHFMFDPSEDEGCPHCSFWANNFNGIPVHLNHRDVSFVAISRAPLGKLEAFMAPTTTSIWSPRDAMRRGTTTHSTGCAITTNMTANTVNLPLPPAALRMGGSHGAYCLGCCWGIMAVLFVVGLMNLAWRAALSALIVAEKLAPRGAALGRLGGIMFIALGVGTVAQPQRFPASGHQPSDAASMSGMTSAAPPSGIGRYTAMEGSSMHEIGASLR